MKKYFIVFLFLPCLLSAQHTLSTLLYQRYPPGIVKKVYDMNNNLGNALDSTAQLRLAATYTQLDSLVVTAIQLNMAPIAVDQYGDSLTWKLIYIDFKSSLTKSEDSAFEEFENGMVVPPPIVNSQLLTNVDMNTLCGKALWHKDEIGLSQQQTRRLIDAVKALYAFSKDPDDGFQKDSLDKKNVSGILGQNEYVSFMAMVNKRSALLSASKAWKEFVRTGYKGPVDEAAAQHELNQYYMQKKVIEMWSVINPAKYDSLMISFKKKPIPQVLAMINIKKKGFPVCLFPRAEQIQHIESRYVLGFTLKHCDSLNLSDSQEVQLITAAQILNSREGFSRAHPDSPKVYVSSFENDNLIKILGEEKYKMMENLKNKSRAVLQSDKDWAELVQRKLVDKAMKERTVKVDFENYNLQNFYIKDRYRSAPDERSRELVLLNIRAPYPVALLLEARRNSPNKNIGYLW